MRMLDVAPAEPVVPKEQLELASRDKDARAAKKKAGTTKTTPER